MTGPLLPGFLDVSGDILCSRSDEGLKDMLVHYRFIFGSLSNLNFCASFSHCLEMGDRRQETVEMTLRENESAHTEQLTYALFLRTPHQEVLLLRVVTRAYTN